MRIIAMIAAALAAAPPACARPCNDVYGCTVRAELCTVEDGAEKCRFERLNPDVGLCTSMMYGAVSSWVNGDAARGVKPHPVSRVGRISCVTPDDFDL